MSIGKRIALVVLIGIVLYPPLKIYWAEHQVTAFCNDVVVGASVEELERAAQDHWLKIGKIPAKTMEGKPSPAKLFIWEGFVFRRWFCEISHANGKVESKHIFDLD